MYVCVRVSAREKRAVVARSPCLCAAFRYVGKRSRFLFGTVVERSLVSTHSLFVRGRRPPRRLPRKAGRGRRRCVVINASLGGDDDATNLVIHVRHDDDP